MTFPTLFMGIGNLFGMPLALAIGRRPVFLLSCLVIGLAGGLCAGQQSFEWHLGSRCIMGLAAGQSEALCPLMVQETFFLHERARTQMYFTAMQNILTSILTLFTSYIAASITVRGWYGLGTGLIGLVFLGAVVFVPETRYDRPLTAYQGQSASVSHWVGRTGKDNDEDNDNPIVARYIVRRVTTTDSRELDTINYKPRTLASDMRLFVNQPDWEEELRTIRRMATVILFPDIFWAFVSAQTITWNCLNCFLITRQLLNGLTLGVNIALSTTYGDVLQAPPYSWSSSVVSFATAGQIIVSFIALPILGFGSDRLVRYLAKRNGGIHQPQYRLVPLVFPIIIGVISSILFGQAAAHPHRIHWIGLVLGLNAYYFAFVGANQCGIVYALDAYPTRSGPVLVAICAMRGVLSFGTSYGVAPFIALRGYDGAYLIYGILTGVLGSLGIVVYFASGRIRAFCSRWTLQTSDTKPTYS